MQPQVHFIGHSHIEALIHGVSEYGLQAAWSAILPNAGGVRTAFVDGDYHLLDHTLQAIDAVDPSALKVASIGGNAHNFLGLLEWSPPFDFYMDGFNESPANGAVIIPYEAVRRRMFNVLYSSDFTMLRALFNDVKNVGVHVQSPPPVKSREIVRNSLDKVILDQNPLASISDPWLRLKLWHVHSSCYEELCNSYNVPYLKAPFQALDADGFLRPELVDPKSSVHANAEYGKLVAKQLMDDFL